MSFPQISCVLCYTVATCCCVNALQEAVVFLILVILSHQLHILWALGWKQRGTVSLCLIKHHPLQTYGGNRRTAPRIQTSVQDRGGC